MNKIMERIDVVMEDFKLYRCIFLKESKDYIIGKDIFNSKIYKIKKNNESLDFKIGTDNSFYAKKEESGLFFKNIVLEVVNYNEILKMAK